VLHLDSAEDGGSERGWNHSGLFGACTRADAEGFHVEMLGVWVLKEAARKWVVKLSLAEKSRRTRRIVVRDWGSIASGAMEDRAASDLV
jgi:hypothetical protein